MTNLCSFDRFANDCCQTIEDYFDSLFYQRSFFSYKCYFSMGDIRQLILGKYNPDRSKVSEEESKNKLFSWEKSFGGWAVDEGYVFNDVCFG